jgi:ribonuclease HII
MKEELHHFPGGIVAAGCDEAGRGCLAGPVFAAAVILPGDYWNPLINDSKKVSAPMRIRLAEEIKAVAVSWGIARAEPEEIDRINILRASILAMHRALEKLDMDFQHILVDGNRFEPFHTKPHTCVIGGDGKYLAIAAASILAKTARDDWMRSIHNEFPVYGWDRNKGYPTAEHIKAVTACGCSPHHRRSFRINRQLMLPL